MAIEYLPPLEAGERSESDPMHQACKLSPLNLRRIQALQTWRKLA